MILRPYLGSIFEKGEEEFSGEENAEKNPRKDMLVQKEDLVKVTRGIWNSKKICQKE